MVSYSAAIFSAIVIFASFYISSSFGVSNETLTSICSKTQHPKECVTSLQTVSYTTSADLPKLSLISLNLTSNQADQNLEAFRDLSHNATRAKPKKEFDDCVRLYRGVKPQIEAAYLLSQKRNYKNNTGLFQAKELALRCEIGVTDNSLVIRELHDSMVLKLDTSITVNQYIARSIDTNSS